MNFPFYILCLFSFICFFWFFLRVCIFLLVFMYLLYVFKHIYNSCFKVVLCYFHYFYHFGCYFYWLISLFIGHIFLIICMLLFFFYWILDIAHIMLRVWVFLTSLTDRLWKFILTTSLIAVQLHTLKCSFLGSLNLCIKWVYHVI